MQKSSSMLLKIGLNMEPENEQRGPSHILKQLVSNASFRKLRNQILAIARSLPKFGNEIKSLNT